MIANNKPESTSSPPHEDEPLEECVILLKKRGIKVVVFDLDLTAVAQHSCGSLLRSKLEGYLDAATPGFRALVPLLHARGFSLAIATHSDEAEFDGDIRPETHIVGAELATCLVEKLFPPDTAESFFTVAYNPRVHPEERNKEEYLVKRYHMREIMKHFQVQQSEILFFDDTPHVVEDCITTCGVVNSFLVNPNHGFRLKDLLDNLR